MSIGRKIKELRSERKMTARELSEKCGIPEKSIYKIESEGVKDPRISSVTAIAKGLGCSIDEIVTGIDVDTITTQMTDVLHGSKCINPIERDYLIFKIEEFGQETRIREYINQNVPEDVAEDLTLMRRLELKKNKTYEDQILLNNLQKEYK